MDFLTQLNPSSLFTIGIAAILIGWIGSFVGLSTRTSNRSLLLDAITFLGVCCILLAIVLLAMRRYQGGF